MTEEKNDTPEAEKSETPVNYYVEVTMLPPGTAVRIKGSDQRALIVTIVFDNSLEPLYLIQYFDGEHMKRHNVPGQLLEPVDELESDDAMYGITIEPGVAETILANILRHKYEQFRNSKKQDKSSSVNGSDIKSENSDGANEPEPEPEHETADQSED